MASRKKPKKFRVIEVSFRNRTVEFELERNLRKWESNDKMFSRFLSSVKSKFALTTPFSIYDPNDQMYVDDIDDLCGCFMGFENNFSFVLKLHVRADQEPEAKEASESDASENHELDLDQMPELKMAPNGNHSASFTPKAQSTRRARAPSAASLNIGSKTPSFASSSNNKRRDRSNSVPFAFPDTNGGGGALLQQIAERPQVPDMDVFAREHQHNECIANTVWLEFGAATIRRCDMLRRLVHALRFYSKLEVVGENANELDREQFTSFCDDTYPTSLMLDDFAHVRAAHHEQLKEIRDIYLPKHGLPVTRTLANSPMAQRHLSGHSGQAYGDDPWTALHIIHFDALHFWLCHLFEAGLRTTPKDRATKSLSDLVTQRQNYTRRQSKKFEVTFTRTANLPLTRNAERLTLRDSVMLALQAKAGKSGSISRSLHRLHAFLDEERYDSDSLVDDLSSEHNICVLLSKNKNGRVLKDLRDSIGDYLRREGHHAQHQQHGLCFYYWPHYAASTEPETPPQSQNGFLTPAQLSVSPMYATLKQEALEYAQVSAWDYHNSILLKAKEYAKTACAKKYAVRFNPHLHFQVTATSLTSTHLVALVLYSDFPDLAEEFASTFQQTHPHESLESVKARHRRFWWLGKTLRETVQYFGSNGMPSFYIKGPFFVYAKECELRELAVTLAAPTSTSKHIEVALPTLAEQRSEGVILRLNNNGDDENARYLRSFDLGWISRFKEEDERLFMGGDWRVRIEAVEKLGASLQPCSRKYLDALFVLDCLMKGTACSFSDTADGGVDAKPAVSPKKQELSAALTKGADAKPINYHKLDRERREAEKKAKEKERAKAKANGKKKSRARVMEFDDSKSDDDAKSETSRGSKGSKGSKEKKSKEKSESYKILKNLMTHKLRGTARDKYGVPRFVVDVFCAMLERRRELTLNLLFADVYFNEFSDLLFKSVEADLASTVDTPWMPNPYRTANCLRASVLELFGELQSITIRSSKFDGFPSYSFSMMSLLSELEASSAVAFFTRSVYAEIRVVATWDEQDGVDEKKEKARRSWIYKMWQAAPKETVRKMLAENGCKIRIDKEKNRNGLWEDWLVIDRVPTY